MTEKTNTVRIDDHGCIDCSECTRECVHRDCMRRNPREIGGIEQCPRMDEARENASLLDRAKELISDFLRQEYGTETTEGTFASLKRIPLAHTTYEDPDDIESHGYDAIQVYADLTRYRLFADLDKGRIRTRVFRDSSHTLNWFIEDELRWLDFDELISDWELP